LSNDDWPDGNWYSDNRPKTLGKITIFLMTLGKMMPTSKMALSKMYFIKIDTQIRPILIGNITLGQKIFGLMTVDQMAIVN